MSRWNDSFSNHAFWSTFNSLKTIFIDESFYVGQDALILMEISRLSKVISYIDSYLEQVDTELIPKSSLDSLNSHISNVLQHIVAFKGNPTSISYMSTSNDLADAALVSVRQMPTSHNLSDKKAIAKINSRFCDDSSVQLKNFLNSEISRKIFETIKKADSDDLLGANITLLHG